MRILMMNHHRTSRSWLRAGLFAEGMATRGHSVTLLVVADSERWHFRRSTVNGVDLVECPDLTAGRMRSGWDPVCGWRRARWLRRENADYDLIHLFETRPATIYPGLALWRRLKVPLVIDWIDWWGRGGLITINRPLWYRFLFTGIETYYEEHFRTCADATTVMSRGLVERAVSLGVARESILHVRNAADLERFHPRPAADMRRKLGYAPDGFHVGFASMDSFLDLDPVLGGFKRLVEHAEDARLVMIGRVHEHIKARINAMGLSERTNYPGFVVDEDYPLHLAACDVFVMPFPKTNYNIGRWPNKFGEYVASGRPVVFNPVGDLADFAGDRAPGIACDDTAEGFAEALIRLHGDPTLCAALGERAREIALEELDWKDRFDRLETIYERLVAERRGEDR